MVDDREILVGGAHPGRVLWTEDESIAWIEAHHAYPLVVYEAALHEGADTADIVLRRVRPSDGGPAWATHVAYAEEDAA